MGIGTGPGLLVLGMDGGSVAEEAKCKFVKHGSPGTFRENDG